MTAPGSHPLVGQVQDLANRVHQLAGEAGRPELSAHLEEEARRYRSPESTVVVVGQAKRGKSSLINALLDHPHLLPVDADVATNVRLVIAAGARAVAEVTRLNDDDQPETFEVPVEELLLWATERGNPNNARAVQQVVVRHQHPLLEQGLVLIDTPGVGGLEAAHTEVTLNSLAAADALLFVTDPSSPITAPELAFLERATHRIDTVLIALTKTDAFRGWHHILDDDRALLRQHAPRFADAPILPVSARLAALGRQAELEGREGLAERARGESRLDDLVEELDRRVLRPDRGARLRNLVRVAERSLDVVEELERARLEAAAGGNEVAVELETQQQRLREVTEATSRWRGDLDVALRQLGLDFDTELEWAIATLDREYERRIAGSSPEQLDGLEADLAETLGALWVNINLYLRDRLVGLLAELIRSLQLEGVDLAPADLEMPDRLGELLGDVRANEPSEDAASKLMNYYPAIFAGSSVSMASSLLAAAGLPALAGGPLVLLSGAAVAGMLALRRSSSRRTRSVRDATKLVRSALPHARSAIAKQFARQLLEVRRSIEKQVGARLDERRCQVEAAVREQQQVVRQDQTARQEVGATADARLARVGALRSQAASLRDELGREGSPAGGGKVRSETIPEPA